MGEQKIFDVILLLKKKCAEYECFIQKTLKLSESEYKGITALIEDETVTCQEFSRRLGLSVSRGSRVIDQLVQKSCIKRSDSPADRRCKHIRLTKKGIEILRKINAEKEKCENRITEDLSRDERAVKRKELESLLRRL